MLGYSKTHIPSSTNGEWRIAPSQDVKREQHLTGRNKQKCYLDPQARLTWDVDGLFDMRMEDSIESGVRGETGATTAALVTPS